MIVGGGFGGLYAARQLRDAPAEVTVVDRRNFHLFQPLLYQVATGGLSPGDITSPIRWVLRKQRNTSVLLATVRDVDAARRRVLLDDRELPYDTLILAAGARNFHFGNEEWARRAPGLKSIEDATAMRRRILFAFEAAEREQDPEQRRAWLNFVVVGGGATGVELAGALAELARDTLRHDFRRIDPRESRILLLEAGERVLPGYPGDLSRKAADALRRLGVELRLETLVREIEDERVAVESKHTGWERVPTRCVLWAAGVRPSPLGEALARSAGARLDKQGRVIVEPDLSLAGHPEIFVIGDLARCAGETGEPLPGVAPVAMQQGRYVARRIEGRLAGRGDDAPFRYRDRGTMATIGRSAAVVDLGWLRFSGFPAWLTWVLVHILFLIEFENRMLVMFQWAWNYVTRNRGARLIVGGSGDGEEDADAAASSR